MTSEPIFEVKTARFEAQKFFWYSEDPVVRLTLEGNIADWKAIVAVEVEPLATDFAGSDFVFAFNQLNTTFKYSKYTPPVSSGMKSIEYASFIHYPSYCVGQFAGDESAMALFYGIDFSYPNESAFRFLRDLDMKSHHTLVAWAKSFTTVKVPPGCNSIIELIEATNHSLESSLL